MPSVTQHSSVCWSPTAVKKNGLCGTLREICPCDLRNWIRIISECGDSAMEIQLWSVTGFIVLPWEVSSSMETRPSQGALLLAWFPLLNVNMTENFSFISFFVCFWLKCSFFLWALRNSLYKCLKYGLRIWPVVKTQLFFLRSNSHIRLNLTDLKESLLLNFLL